jgi:hypothetical protein
MDDPNNGKTKYILGYYLTINIIIIIIIIIIIQKQHISIDN